MGTALAQRGTVITFARRTALAALLGSVLLLGQHCTGVPEPVPIPAPPRIELLRASKGPPGGEGPVHLVGLPGIVSGAGVIRVDRNGARSEAQSSSAAEGSFSLIVSARVGDVLRLHFESSAASDPYTVTTSSGVISHTPQPSPGIPPLSGPVAGVVTVRGETPVPLAVLGVNMQTGDVALTPKGSDRTFTLQLRASSGQTLRLYADEDPLDSPWELTVP